MSVADTAPDIDRVMDPAEWLNTPSGMIYESMGIVDPYDAVRLDPSSPQARVAALIEPFAVSLRDPDVGSDDASRDEFVANLQAAAESADVDSSMAPWLARASLGLGRIHSDRAADVSRQDSLAAMGEADEVSPEDIAARDDALHASNAVNLFIRGGLRGSSVQSEVNDLITRFRRKGIPKDFDKFVDKRQAKMSRPPRDFNPMLRLGLAASNAMEGLKSHKKAVLVLGGLAVAAAVVDRSGMLHTHVASVAANAHNHLPQTGGGGLPPGANGEAVTVGKPVLAHLPANLQPTGAADHARDVHTALTSAHGQGGIEQVGAQGHVTWADGSNANHVLHYEPGPNGSTYIRLEGVDPSQSIINGHAVDLNTAHGLFARITVTGPDGHQQFFEVPIKHGQAQVFGDFSKLTAGHDVQVQIVQHTGHGGESIFSTAVSNGHHVSGHEASHLSHEAHSVRGRGAPGYHRRPTPPVLPRTGPKGSELQQLLAAGEFGAAVLVIGSLGLLASGAGRATGRRIRGLVVGRGRHRSRGRRGGEGRRGRGDDDEEDDDDELELDEMAMIAAVQEEFRRQRDSYREALARQLAEPDDSPFRRRDDRPGDMAQAVARAREAIDTELRRYEDEGLPYAARVERIRREAASIAEHGDRDLSIEPPSDEGTPGEQSRDYIEAIMALAYDVAERASDPDARDDEARINWFAFASYIGRRMAGGKTPQQLYEYLTELEEEEE